MDWWVIRFLGTWFGLVLILGGAIAAFVIGYRMGMRYVLGCFEEWKYADRAIQSFVDDRAHGTRKGGGPDRVA